MTEIITMEVETEKSFNFQVNKTKVKMLEIHYLDDSGGKQTFDIKQNSVVIDNKEEFIVGYTTKLNGMRWGIELSFKNSTISLTGDRKSPITHLKFSLEG